VRLYIEGAIKAALNKLFERDAELLSNDINERTITHKFAEYLVHGLPSLSRRAALSHRICRRSFSSSDVILFTIFTGSL
jgi:hypothetical protein